MGFDQYHEPPEELPAETRTFARLCASLTEEAEAIGWYQQRLAVEPDPQARAIMNDAIGEEYKHFSMDLEFLLRRTPLWREIAEGILFQPGDIVEHGEEAEEEATSLRRTRRSRRPVGRPWHRRPQGTGAMNHLLRSIAPIAEPGWELLDTEARERLTVALAARKLVDFSGAAAGTTRRRTSAAPMRSRRPPGDGVAAAQRRVLALVELRSEFSVSREELRDAERGAEDVDWMRSTRRLAGSRSRRTWRSSTASSRPASSASRRPRPSPRSRWATTSTPIQARGQGGRAVAPPGHRRSLRVGARPGRLHGRDRDDRARRLSSSSTTSARSSTARSSGRRASRERWS